MKKMLIGAAAGLALVAATLPVTSVAREATAPQLQAERLEADLLGQTRSLSELMAQQRPPFRNIAPTPVEEVPNFLTPDFLRNVRNVDAPAGPAMLSPMWGQAPAADLSFGGFDNLDNAALFGFRLTPPDTEGDVGRTHYVQWNNVGFKVFLKDGTEMTPPNGLPGNIFWQGIPHPCASTNMGDPIVLYDHLAGRWFFSQFAIGPGLGFQCTAISSGEDPLASSYTLYALPNNVQECNDYPKVGIWTSADGSQSAYHFTTNEFGASCSAGFIGALMVAWDRDAMLASSFVNGLGVFLPYTGAAPVAYSLQPGHLEGPTLPPPGACETYIQTFDSETWGVPGDPDGYRTWAFCVDWVGVNGFVVELPFQPLPFEFDSNMCGFNRNCIPQPGTATGLDALGQMTMYRFSIRNVRGAWSGLISHTVDLGGNLAGFQWAKFDMNGAPPFMPLGIADVGQYDVGDGQHRWMPSISQDGDGNIGIGYTKSSSSHFPSVYFTGRLATDPPGTLAAESVCIDGTGSHTDFNRWGDYSTVSIDPVDDCTFWVTNEYVETTGRANWDTQICTFRFPSCGEPLNKYLVAGNDRNGDGQPDRVVEAGVNFGAAYFFEIDYFNPGGPNVIIRDVVPREWNAFYLGGTAPCSVIRADERRNLYSDNHITCDPGDNDQMVFAAFARCGDIPGDPSCHPYECGAFFLNFGASAYAGRALVEGPTAPICLAAVKDMNGGGIDFTGNGDEDGDGVDDYTEACIDFTDPCSAR